MVRVGWGILVTAWTGFFFAERFEGIIHFLSSQAQGHTRNVKTTGGPKKN